jgi:hypothetical protein
MIKVAIVGPEESKWIKKDQVGRAKIKIKEVLALNRYSNKEHLTTKYDTVLVSGHCPRGGVDIWAEEIAKEMNCYKPDYIFTPDVNQWNDQVVENKRLLGYKSRNKAIAQICDILYCIVPYQEYAKCPHHKGEIDQIDHPSNGGCWTRAYARSIGKRIYFYVID